MTEYERGKLDKLEEIKATGIKGEVRAFPVPSSMDENGHTDDFDVNFYNEEIEICLNGAEDIVYGKASTHIIEPKRGYLVFIPEEEITNPVGYVDL